MKFSPSSWRGEGEGGVLTNHREKGLTVNMAQGNKMSQTMRIDLIPDIPSQPETGKKQVVFATPTQKHKRVRLGAPEGGPEESPYKQLLQSLYDAALICDLSGKIIDVNVRAEEFLAYEREELCSLSVFDVIAGTSKALLATLCENLEDERFTLIQAYCVRRDGSFFPSEIAVSRLGIGEKHLSFFVRDRTLQRQAEEMLRTEHNAIQNSGNGIAVVDLGARLEYVNPAVGLMWGYADPDTELLGQDVRTLLDGEAKANEMLNGALGPNRTWFGEMKAKRKDGSEFDVQISAVCNRNSDGESIGIVFSFVDISDRMRAEEATREAERQRVMLESLGAACHHLGQPATVLLANLGIIQRRWSVEDGVAQELLQSSIKAAETLGEILHRLNTVNEYRTTKYLDRPDSPDSAENRILQI